MLFRVILIINMLFRLIRVILVINRLFLLIRIISVIRITAASTDTSAIIRDMRGLGQGEITPDVVGEWSDKFLRQYKNGWEFWGSRIR